MTLYWSLHDTALPATVNEGLTEGPYVAARAGFEFPTLRSKVFDSTNAPPRPTFRVGKTLEKCIEKHFPGTEDTLTHFRMSPSCLNRCVKICMAHSALT